MSPMKALTAEAVILASWLLDLRAGLPELPVPIRFRSGGRRRDRRPGHCLRGAAEADAACALARRGRGAPSVIWRAAERSAPGPTFPDLPGRGRC